MHAFFYAKKMGTMKLNITINALWIFLLQACQSTPTTQVKDPLFILLDSARTGIDFVNKIEQGPKTNIFMYEYFFNGAGVAAGDLNGDGLDDLYFTANLHSNKIFLNKGNLQFEDITNACGAAGRPGPWKTGVSFVDINGDGQLDIHIAYSGVLSEARLHGQLFLNTGNNEAGIPQFQDITEQAGLAFPVQCHQALFFDYDKDGDLDMLLQNHNRNPLPPMDESRIADMLQQEDAIQGIRLLQNNPTPEGMPRFADVTQQAGIHSSPLTYGLGIAIADVNGDGWDDFYVCNDYIAPDYLYINNQRGGFDDELGQRLTHTSHFSMGNDIADLNNDGLPEILTLDMLPEDNRRQKLLLSLENYENHDLNVRSGLHAQYMRNMLHANMGNGMYSEVGQLAGISNTDWSWAALLADYDNDGYKDLFISNGYLRDFTNQDFVKYVGNYMGRAQGKLSEQMVLEMVEKMPASNVANYLYRNEGELQFSNQTTAWGMGQPSNSNGAVWTDLDNDGDLDLVVNNINQQAYLWQNTAAQKKGGYLKISLEGNGLNRMGLGAQVRIHTGGTTQWLQQHPYRGYQSTVSPVLHAGLGTTAMVDSLHITWPSGKVQVLTGVAANSWLTLREADAALPAKPALPPPAAPLFTEKNTGLNWTHAGFGGNDFKRQPLMVHAQSDVGPCMAAADINGDGHEDLYIGGGAGQSGLLLLGSANGNMRPRSVPALEADKAHADAAATWLDANSDGHPDLYVGSGGYHTFLPNDTLLQDRLYLGDGKGGLTKALGALPALLTSTGCVAAADINGDGHTDLFVGGRVVPGHYPEAPRSYVLINDGKGIYTDATLQVAPALEKPGMVTAAQWADLGGKGKPSLVIAGMWMPVRIFDWDGSQLTDQTTQYMDYPQSGWWHSLLITDLNGDGKADILAGNYGLNSQVRASVAMPATLHFKDFDRNGAIDPIFGFGIQGTNYPYITRDELLDHMTMMRSRFGDYASYANATLQDIFYPEELEGTQLWAATQLATTLWLQDAHGKLQPASLPAQAQWAPVHALATMDANGDGLPDVWMMGNSTHNRLRLGKMDANYGLLLLNRGQGRFEAAPPAATGLLLRSNVRALHVSGSSLWVGSYGDRVRQFGQ
jgi:hypothetical protein